MFTSLGKSVAEALTDEAHQAAVVLIDIEGPKGEIRDDKAANHGFHARFDELSVLEHQVEVLKVAAVHGVPVFDVTTTAPQAQTVKQLASLFDDLDVSSFKKTANNPFDGKGAQRGEITLESDLAKSGRKVIVVMGYHANQCVNSTIFGNPGINGIPPRKGLMDLGYKVITARNVVASDGNAALQPEYGPMV